ncbi:hypothetical protein PUN28_002231 [Cardiocondyla obscurior]|uniref:Secreted protein n=1 Tax=Cardiocondyla obscurior TaxID=286306 RepID=A0AAW2GT69_9HYME
MRGIFIFRSLWNLVRCYSAGGPLALPTRPTLRKRTILRSIGSKNHMLFLLIQQISRICKNLISEVLSTAEYLHLLFGLQTGKFKMFKNYLCRNSLRYVK